jgi:hypothetical protein
MQQWQLAMTACMVDMYAQERVFSCATVALKRVPHGEQEYPAHPAGALHRFDPRRDVLVDVLGRRIDAVPAQMPAVLDTRPSQGIYMRVQGKAAVRMPIY